MWTWTASSVTRASLLAALAVCGGCAIIQPSSRGAPIADTVGAVVMTGATTIAVAAYHDPSGQGRDFTNDSGYTAGVLTLGGIAFLYACSALYGFTRDPATQSSDKPILGVRILTFGIAGAAAGWSAGSTRQGCCSYHGGVSGCANDSRGDNRVVCEDGQFSPTCLCAE
jgi:hypothetical protein